MTNFAPLDTQGAGGMQSPTENKIRKIDDPDYYKNWYNKNREKILLYRKSYIKSYYQKNYDKFKSYYEENKDRLKEKYAEKVECECGIMVCKKYYKKHITTDKHKLLIEKKQHLIDICGNNIKEEGVKPLQNPSVMHGATCE